MEMEKGVEKIKERKRKSLGGLSATVFFRHRALLRRSAKL